VTASTLDRTASELDPQDPVEEFTIEAVHGDSGEIVVVRGELDIATAPLLEAVLDTVVSQRPQRLDVDLAGVTFLDAHALAALNTARRRLTARHATMVLRRPSPIARRVLALTGLDRLFDIAV
jgi:anti-sigma B factor antagonist